MENKRDLILIVDDEEQLLELNNIALSAKGFEVLQAKNGKEALEWLDRKGKDIKLILLDIVMPVMDGFEFLEEIAKSEYKNIPVVVNSNLGSDADRQSAFALGAKDFFEKVKMTPGQVADAIKKIVDGIRL